MNMELHPFLRPHESTTGSAGKTHGSVGDIN